MGYESKREDIARCLECGDEISYGRADKKFCCDKCKNSYHNTRNSENLRIQSRTIHCLKINHNILSKLLAKEITSISICEICNLGFNLYLSTGYRSFKLRTVFICFNIRYRMSDSKIFDISYIDNADTIFSKKK